MAPKKTGKAEKGRRGGVALLLTLSLCGNFHRLGTLTGRERLPEASPREFPRAPESFAGGEGFASGGEKIDVSNMDGSAASPACRPHFNLALPDDRWSNSTKFKRIYFYHARKAGGSSFAHYLRIVSHHYGLEFKAREWGAMEEPGTYGDGATFYVTLLREPVSRSISHFKYQGRWDCRDLVGGKATFAPTEENANKLETWNQTGGHVPFKCKNPSDFRLALCAVNCFVQWFSGSCPQWGIPLDRQYHTARARVLRYNFAAVIEKFSEPAYVESVERFFGVPGLQKRITPFCEKESHAANENAPLIVHNDTRERLKVLNAVDRQLYHELSNCLESSTLDFPRWNPNRFELHTHNLTGGKKNAEAK